MIWTKRALQSAKRQTFDCSRKISPNLYFYRLLKVYKMLAKKYSGDMTLKIDAKFEEKMMCCFKNDENLVKFHPTRKSPKLALSFAPIV